jgi:DNA-directed RNA polymerase specialized sigma24 family protein
MQAKKEEILEEAKAGVSDDAKDAIIKEYLEKLKAEEAAKQSADQDSKPE